MFARGENVLAAVREDHLERYVKDRFAKVNLEVAPPLVSYKVTIEGEVLNVMENLKVLSRVSNYVEKTTPNGRCVVWVWVMKLLPSLTKVLDEMCVTHTLCTAVLGRIFHCEFTYL